MSLFIPYSKLKTRETDAGIYMVWKCPQCQELRDLHLIVRNTSLSFVCLSLSETGDMLDLHCPHCAYELKILPSERPLLESARHLTSSLKVGALSQEAYIAELTALPATFMKDLLSLTQVWKCSQCGEENPVGFESCWKCGPTASSDSEGSDGDAYTP